MKRFLLSLALLALSAVFASAQDTLADAARAQQAKKKAPSTGHVYTNESMEFHAPPPNTPPAKTDASSSSDAKADKADGTAAAAPDAPAPEDKAKAADALKEKVAKQKDQIALLQRELDVLQRENR